LYLNKTDTNFSSTAMNMNRSMSMCVMGELVELRESQRMKMNEWRKALRLARENRPWIVEKGYEHLG